MGSTMRWQPILATGEFTLQLIVGALFIFGGLIGLIAGLKKHHVGNAVSVGVGLMVLGYLLIGWWGLLTPLALAFTYLWGRYA